ncbi:uncharacterized protein LOC117318540 [Pecten maximus]|uniref:uncharacterized protein LOC117318540 n=1 Tax=Pecten maximus TaxID=6579 RepID=UPI0014590AF0|nr:uncharacterized protein LOC117318540 [Pecten maximus]
MAESPQEELAAQPEVKLGAWTEADLIKSLNALGKYAIVALGEETQTRRLRTSSVIEGNASLYEFPSTKQQNIPKVPQFSGESLKGDVAYMDWRYEIRCLIMDSDISPSTLIQAIRRSLRGVAKRSLISLGSEASPRDILHRLDSLFGEVATHGMIMQEFFNAAQKPEESATTFGCRLESYLQIAIDNGSVDKGARNDLLRHKFWTSLYSDNLKSQTRHKYDNIMSFDHLLREIRIVEKELDLCSSTACKSQDSSKKKKAQSHNVTAEVDQQQASSVVVEVVVVVEVTTEVNLTTTNKNPLITQKSNGLCGRPSGDRIIFSRPNQHLG